MGGHNHEAEAESVFDFEEMSAACQKALKFAFTLRRRNEGRDIPWFGPNYTHANHASPCEALRAESLAYSEEDQGRDALTEIVNVILQLGFEQGRRAKAHHTFELLDRTHGATFTIRVGYDENNTSVHTAAGMLAEPEDVLSRAIDALLDEASRLANCPRHRAKAVA